MSFTKAVAIFVLLGVSMVLAAPQGDLEPIPILRANQEGPNPDGSYAWSYETGNGIQAQEQGAFVQEADQEPALSVQGSYSYQAEDGTPIRVTYKADKDGFQPQGDHLPVAPEIPQAIIKALEWIANHPEEDNLRK